VIKVTKLNREVFYVNPTLIEMVEKTPDTVITLINGKKIIVLESIEEIRDIFTEYFKVAGMIIPQVVFNSFTFSEDNEGKINANKAGTLNIPNSATK
jgi:Uncharacterized protein, possibly involved in motility